MRLACLILPYAGMFPKAHSRFLQIAATVWMWHHRAVSAPFYPQVAVLAVPSGHMGQGFTVDLHPHSGVLKAQTKILNVSSYCIKALILTPLWSFLPKSHLLGAVHFLSWCSTVLWHYCPSENLCKGSKKITSVQTFLMDLPSATHLFP